MQRITSQMSTPPISKNISTSVSLHCFPPFQSLNINTIPPGQRNRHHRPLQAVYELLKKSTTPRFIPISTSAASLDGRAIKFPKSGLEYGATKAALNWATRKIHFENEWLSAFMHSIMP